MPNNINRDIWEDYYVGSPAINREQQAISQAQQSANAHVQSQAQLAQQQAAGILSQGYNWSPHRYEIGNASVQEALAAFTERVRLYNNNIGEVVDNRRVFFANSSKPIRVAKIKRNLPDWF